MPGTGLSGVVPDAMEDHRAWGLATGRGSGTSGICA